MKKENVLSPKSAVDCASDLVVSQYKEHFIGLYLDSRNRVIYKEVVSMGTLNACIVHPREVFHPAIKKHSAQIIVLHNHPSGNVEPSDDDLKVYRRLTEAGEILGIELLDSIIFNKQGKFYSCKEH